MIKDDLIAILSAITYPTQYVSFPVYQQGSLGRTEAYPESFWTFWNNTTVDSAHYDNNPIAFVWDFDVNFYSNRPSYVNNVLPLARAALRDAGWIVSGIGHDVPSDEISHTGRGFQALFVERIVPDEPEPEPEPQPDPTDDPDDLDNEKNQEQEGG